ncbi:MAG: peptidase M19 [Acidimicrobiales bacterium]|nr:peptidase M19 [Hyphomonadaceae bacterium]RZV38949.1 MAG: peptidase M19 [Acidimicrobiales bacterium]
MLKIIGILVSIALLAGGYFVFMHLPTKVDAKMNAVSPRADYSISNDALQLHDQLRVADLHADTLLWKRDPAKRHTFGQTDLPRFRQGGVVVQVFSTVTFVPAGQNEQSNAAKGDLIRQLAMAQGWPPSTWFSIYERAAHQARGLKRLESDNFIIAYTKTDLIEGLKAREVQDDMLIGILATEGAHPLEGKLNNIDRLYDHGFRLIGLQHFFDNKLGGSLHGAEKGGLTPFGKQAVERMVGKGMMIDVAHSSIKVVEDVLKLTDAPLIVSHTGILSLCDHPARNIPDRLMQQIADGGGLIGIGYWEMAVCDTSPDGIADMLIHGANQFGVDHIALGSDFDGSIKAEFDTSQLALLTNALMRKGMNEADIAKVMGENLIAYLSRNLPD